MSTKRAGISNRAGACIDNQSAGSEVREWQPPGYRMARHMVRGCADNTEEIDNSDDTRDGYVDAADRGWFLGQALCQTTLASDDGATSCGRTTYQRNDSQAW